MDHINKQRLIETKVPQKLPRSQMEITNMLARKVFLDIKAPEKLVLVVLSSYGDSEGGSIYPSLKTLSAMTGMSKSALCSTLTKLETKDYILRKRGSGKDGANETTSYQLNLTKLGGYKYEYPKQGRPILRLV